MKNLSPVKALFQSFIEHNVRLFSGLHHFPKSSKCEEERSIDPNLIGDDKIPALLVG